jgi:hypothetical protein
LKDLSSMYYRRELSRVCGYMRELYLTFFEKKNCISVDTRK